MFSYIYDLATERRRGPMGGIVKSVLFILSLIYGLVVRALAFIYRRRSCRLNCRVIGIGNITLGGTGKTSLVLLVANYLKERGHKVAILTRGYKRKGAMGDEPYMLRMNLKDVPVLVDADRVRGAKLAMRNYAADTVILDDAFQQWRIKKDLEVVTIDSASPFGNRRLIPRGILREPLSSLKRADVFVLTKADLCPDPGSIEGFLDSVNPQALKAESVHSPVGFCKFDSPGELLGVNTLRGRKAALFCAIGDPDSFESIIRSLGIEIGLSFKFRDHHNYTREELDSIMRKSREAGIDTVLTTEKDAARLYESGAGSWGLKALFLRIELKIIKNEQGFYDRLLSLYSH